MVGIVVVYGATYKGVVMLTDVSYERKFHYIIHPSKLKYVLKWNRMCLGGLRIVQLFLCESKHHIACKGATMLTEKSYEGNSFI